jgi:hypothetical protein
MTKIEELTAELKAAEQTVREAQDKAQALGTSLLLAMREEVDAKLESWGVKVGDLVVEVYESGKTSEPAFLAGTYGNYRWGTPEAGVRYFQVKRDGTPSKRETSHYANAGPRRNPHRLVKV